MILFVMFLLVGSFVSADEQCFQPSSVSLGGNGTDTWTDSDSPAVSSCANPQWLAAKASTSINRAFVNWNHTCPSIPDGATINNVTLQIDVYEILTNYL